MTASWNRRQLLGALSGAGLAVRSWAAPRQKAGSSWLTLEQAPASINVWTEGGSFPLTRNGNRWQAHGVEAGLQQHGDALGVTLRAPHDAVLRMQVRWQFRTPERLELLGDAWERSYGDLGWRGMEPERVLPWYFLAFDGRSTAAAGVKTGAGAFCFWRLDPAGVSLWLDVRNGGRGVKLGSRELVAASLVTGWYPETRPFRAATEFCRAMCGKPRLPASPVYGGNNWYYAYGRSSAEDIRADSERIVSFASSSANRPWMVIDDGWSPNATAGPWSRGNGRFPDMPQLASEMKRIGARPGLWVRPLFTREAVAEGWRLQSPNAALEYKRERAYTMDPTVPEVLESVQQDIRRSAGWGFEMIKHDFSTYDLLGRWGFRMDDEITDPEWGFRDGTRTNAEIILDFYRALRTAAEETMLLGCNTVGHLGAGIFELQRIGDDTSGRDWSRTRKMGVNTLAFRAPQHDAFFAVDADCVGLTKQIPWNLNRQWLDLLARSGTPLFVSAAPDAVGAEQRAALKEAFAIAAKPRALAEPLDWLRTTEPGKWNLGGQAAQFDWFG